MRIARTDIIAGLPSTLARDVTRQYRGQEGTSGWAAEILRRGGFDDVEGVFSALQAEGYLEIYREDGEDVWWTNTIKGNALSMASFGKPITRATADRLLAGLVDRAREYNADPGKPMFIQQLRVFGSYLDDSVQHLGDLDVELSYDRRLTDPKALHDYTSRSGRNFSSFIDRLYWPTKELIMFLRNRSTAISIVVQDIDQFTDNSRVVYTIADDQGAVPPPARTIPEPLSVSPTFSTPPIHPPTLGLP